ncbi:unnamed protein product [Rotaria sp. Silwood2]|nr:unnamed protein product [Rotaria sp. Silwood2]CAF2900935.1 unnamed protein product [Rotaria sp. Silwood2]CAF2994632.1 unnamed protein product [Rotaria sp. Silwood2]CAF3332268.1 unnamed protein product [Rotaria sp. Silwood2]CAF4039940.1 unnamed protein product [Rotaria sp. Silwood2]
MLTMLATIYVTCFAFASLSFNVAQQQPLRYVDGYRSSCKFHQGGTFNLIVSAPHRGSLMPTDVPDRTQGGCRHPGKSCTWIYNDACVNDRRCTTTTVQDNLSDEFVENVAEELNIRYGLKPFVVIGKWHRKKVDFNREINQATLNHPKATSVYRSYHSNLQYAINQVKQLYGKGLLVDVHGQGKGKAPYSIEMTSKQLLVGLRQSNKSVLCQIEPNAFDDKHRSVQLWKKKQLGIVYPSMVHPKPGNRTFLEGGYITCNYISKINAIQTELPWSIRGGTYKLLNAKRYARTLINYMRVNNLLKAK